MSGALDADQRASLERLVAEARRILERDLASQAAGRYGIDADGAIAAEEDLRLDATALAYRREIVDVADHLRSEGAAPAGAVARLLREAVFTHLNRLVAIRIAEAQGLLPPSLADGRSSQGFRDLLEAVPLLASDDTGGYWAYLQLCADELAADVPTLFDPRNPLLALAPTPRALDELARLLAEPASAALWSAPDCLGWVYQFFNTREERAAMRAASTAPRDSRELAVRNQFFTPRYVVDFLVQNSLGRRLIDVDPDSPLLADLPLLIDPPTAKGAAADHNEVAVLDPACGSGHFLLAAYDLLERAWHHQGVSPLDAAPAIVRSLWGIDIDPRCAQVAAAAVMFRARRSCPDGDLPRPNIACARSLPATATGLDDVLSSLPRSQRSLIERLTEALADAPVLGSLLRIEETMAAEIKGTIIGGPALPGTFADSLAAQTIQALENDLLANLTRLARATTASPAERLFAAEADDAIRFVQALQRRYDAVVMNPPFGEPVPDTKPYLKAAYPWIPSTNDLFALFVGRGLELSKDGGYVASITSRVGMFLTSFEEWRRSILLGHDLIALADLGEGVMEQAMVEAAAYVLGRRHRDKERKPIFIRAVTDKDRASTLSDAIAALQRKEHSPHVFMPDLDRLTNLTGSPVAYWVDPEAIDVLASHEKFEPSYGLVRVGLQTSDDFRFIRAWWEVPSHRLTRSPALEGGRDARTQLARGARWVPIIKGGSSQPWYSPVLLVVDWEGDGRRIRQVARSRGESESRTIRSESQYFRPGFSWTRRAPRLFPYVVPAGCIPSVSRYQAFPLGNPYAMVGLVASNVASAFCRFYGEQFLRPNFLVDNVKSLPIPAVSDALATGLTERVREGVQIRQEIYRHLEPYREFTWPAQKVEHLAWDTGSLLGESLEGAVAASYGLSPSQAEGLERDMSEALAAFGTNVAELEGDEEDLGDILPWGERLFSYLAGAAFGRWDIRIGRDPTRAGLLPDPFDPPPAAPPGMLVDGQERPVAVAPSDYPLSIPQSGLLLDEPGHSWDIETRVDAAISYMFDNAEEERSHLLMALDRRTMREYLRRQFFRDHLKVYTKGRRKAPIYWPLYVPSSGWGVWVYAPRLSRETLFAIISAATDRLVAAEAEIARLQRERATGGAGRSARQVAAALESEERLAGELARFRDEAERIAGLGWEPDLDDGTILCAAPLAGIFPAWRDATAARDQIRAGKYPWASVSRWADKL